MGHYDVIHRKKSTQRNVLHIGSGFLRIRYYECVSLVRPMRTLVNMISSCRLRFTSGELTIFRLMVSFCLFFYILYIYTVVPYNSHITLKVLHLQCRTSCDIISGLCNVFFRRRLHFVHKPFWAIRHRRQQHDRHGVRRINRRSGWNEQCNHARTLCRHIHQQRY